MWRRSFSKMAGQIPLTFPSVKRDAFPGSPGRLKTECNQTAASGTPVAAGQGPLDLATLERNHILTVLEQTSWVIDGPRGAAKVLGLHPNTQRSRLKKLGIARGTHERS